MASPQGTVSTASTRGDELDIRPARTEDREHILELVGGEGNVERAEVAWTYDRHPWGEHDRLFVGEHDDRIVGVCGFVPLRLNAGDRVLRAVSPAHLVVDPARTGRGIERTMLDGCLRKLARAGAVLAVELTTPFSGTRLDGPDARSVPGTETYVRIHRPAALSGRPLTRPLDRLCSRVTDAMSRLRLRAARLGQTVSDVPMDVASTQDVPASLLAELHSGMGPDRLHVRRDEEFLRWRFARPSVESRTYVGYRHGAPSVALVVERTDRRGPRIGALSEVVPLDPDARPSGVLPGLIARATADLADVDAILAPEGPFPGGTLERLGFLSDRRFPLAPMLGTGEHRIRPLSWVHPCTGLDDSRAWMTSLAETTIP